MPGRLRRIKALKTATDIHIGASPAHVSLYGLRGNNAAGWVFRYGGRFLGVFLEVDGRRRWKCFSPLGYAERE